jgi:CRISPR-associated protein Csd2
MSEVINKRYEFVLLFDVENGNPNGDPDAGNMPRIDPETGQGIVTDVCIKRKIRNYVEIAKESIEGYKDDVQRYEIYVKDGAVLNSQHSRAYDYVGIKTDSKEVAKDKDLQKSLTKFMCNNFYDVRTFGAVMSTKVDCGTVRGPVQINFAKSIDPIFQQEVTITRIAITKEGEEKKTEMGRKHIVPYGLYRAEGYVSAELARRVTGFTEADLELLWEALINMFEHDHSAARGKMATRKLIVFEHETSLGNAPSHILFDKVKVNNIKSPSRSIKDYEIIIDKSTIAGVNIIEKL